MSGRCASPGSDQGLREKLNELATVEYFHGFLPKEEVMDLLKQPGEFLLRIKFNEVLHVSVMVEKTEVTNRKRRRRRTIAHIPIHEEVTANGTKYYFDQDCWYTKPSALIMGHIRENREVRSGIHLERPVTRVWWELMDDQVDLKERKRLGSGEFGEVFKAKLYRHKQKRPQQVAAENPTKDESVCDESSLGAELKVAVKVCTAVSEESWVEFLEEGRTLRPIQHPNIVRFYGLLITQRPVMIVLELMDTTLERLLSTEKTRASESSTASKSSSKADSDSNDSDTINLPLNFDEKIRVVLNIAEAMEYLTGKMGMVHRDLAPRNCLISFNARGQRIAKLGDFGLARKMAQDGKYRATTPERLDKSRQSPEALWSGKYGEWTVQSDVWGFGVLLWEMWSGGRKPYGGMPAEIVEMEIKEGRRLRPPHHMPVDICRIMLHTWIPRSSQRISFPQLIEDLMLILKGQKTRKRASVSSKSSGT